MTTPRKLWKVTQARMADGGTIDDPATEQHPESKAKVYGIYVPNAARARTHDFMDVWVDNRDGHGWRLHERIDLAEYGTEC